MTRAEYLEAVEESFYFTDDPFVRTQAAGLGDCTDPSRQLRDTEEVCKALQNAHLEYCQKVEAILFPERFSESHPSLVQV